MSENGPQRTRPFVLLTGTPGTGKTSTASLIAVRKKQRNDLLFRTIEFLATHSKYEDKNTNVD